ncbi:MAG: hypothetical protein R3B07_21360 [Polyangiaceae bacterium]
MKASPQARINRRVLFLSVAVAGAAAVAYRAVTPTGSKGAARGWRSSANAPSALEPAGSAPRAASEERLELEPRVDLPSSVLQPYPSQPRPGEASAALPRHAVNSYELREADQSLKLQVLPPTAARDPWTSELSYQGGVVWQHSGDVANARGLLELELPAQRMKSGRYTLFVALPGGRRYLYLFDVALE